MDKIEQYRKFIKQILTEHAPLNTSNELVDSQLIFDTEHDHYQLSYVGWRGYKRVFGPVMHFDIIDGKIWLQYNGTEDSVAEQLVEMGVPRSDIIIGFHSPFKRQFNSWGKEEMSNK
ncbi:MAG: XisI protein [Spirulinaceae cyanobacterium]